MNRTLALSIAVVTMAVPFFASAQTQTDLSQSIRAALAGDPRTSSMSQAQLDATVAALSEGAQQKGMTSEDIAWRPVPTEGGAALVIASCGGFPSYLCSMSEAFGFTGPDYIFAIWLGVAALLLVFIIGALLEYRHFRHLHPKHTAAQP